MGQRYIASKVVFLIAALFVCGIGGAFAQDDPKTVNAKYLVVPRYNVSFMIPPESVEGTNPDEPEMALYWGRPKNVVGDAAAFIFTSREQPNADTMSTMLADRYYMEGFAAGVAKQVAGTYKFTVSEKKLVKIAGLNALKIDMTITSDKGKPSRHAIYSIPCPEHKRLYIFNVITAAESFDKWFAVAEPSVNSFKILKAN